MYGTQTGLFVMYVANPFENDVNMHGTQTILEFCLVIFRFENDVSKNNFKHILKKPWINTEAFNYLFKFLKILVIF